MALSDKAKQSLLQTALVGEYQIPTASPIPKNLTVEEVFPDKVIYNVDGQLYEATYTLDEEGQAVFGEPQKVTSTKTYTAMEALSMENKRSLLDPALSAHLNLPKEQFFYIEDMTDADVFYNRERQSFKIPYTLTEDGNVSFGTSTKVVRQTTYKTIEALQAAYSRLIQEAAARDLAGNAKVKAAIVTCRGILEAKAPTEKKTQEALKEATTVLAWLQEQAMTKAEGGVNYPQAAFAYVANIHKPGTWQLRMWEDPDKKVTKGQLGRIAAALSPGGLRGQKASIPSDDLPAVKRKIRAAYRKLNIAEDDMPRWVKESETRELVRNFMPLTEATFDKGRATVIVIKPGFNASEDRYYPAEMLKRDFGVFEGQKMYADHPTEEEDKARPERSIKDWVATLTDVSVDESGVVTGTAEIVEPWLMQKLASLRDKEMLSEMGISINAVGNATKGTIEGKDTLVIEQLVACRSVDFVTEPGAGGEVTLYESDRNDVDLMDLANLKERRPDLVKLIEAALRADIQQEVKEAMEDKERVIELDGKLTTMTAERDDLKGKIEEAETARVKAEAQATIKEAVDKAELPQAAKDRLLKTHEDVETADGIAEAIQAEVDYIAKLSESGTVRGLGGPRQESKGDEEALSESMKRSHPEWTDAQIQTAVSGR